MKEALSGLELIPSTGNVYKFYYPEQTTPTYIKIVSDNYTGVVLPYVLFDVLQGYWPPDKSGSFHWGSEIHRRLHKLNEVEELLYGKS